MKPPKQKRTAVEEVPWERSVESLFGVCWSGWVGGVGIGVLKPVLPAARLFTHEYSGAILSSDTKWANFWKNKKDITSLST